MKSSKIRFFAAEAGSGGWPASSWTPATWDALVRSSERASYLQTTGWARVKAATGWSAVLIGDAAGKRGENETLGGQLLTLPIPMTPWRFAYAPRGPIAANWNPHTIPEWTIALKAAALGRGALAGTAIVRIDPEIEAGSAFGQTTIEDWLRSTGWRRAPDMQPHRTRIVDLGVDEAALWSGLRKKWRQYVNKARSNGIVVRDVDPSIEPDAFDTFHRVLRDVAKRTALPLRSAQTFREIWEAFAPTGECRLLFADDASGATQAVLLLVRCGTRVVEPYGGMTDAGADSRANYLLKWEAIRTSRDQGATSYDMWGLIGTGIDYFKEGFGGREVTYVGAWDLALSPVGARVFRAGERGRHLYRALRRRLRGEKLALPAAPGSEG
ncbi:MAG TPA: peptidoglycan bridge formation glycyltransferase FemA/FemB family protein [Candidatus Dormibacteraeota bacterium]|nr:peptidoglycan bridge formation glycyltransferase FemA/FemB family protein [Candidatus Dormibacteraeota bacterium]